MKNTPKNVLILITVNIIFILLSLIENGFAGIITIPLLFIINLIVAIIATSNNDKSLKTAAIILIFVGPIIGFSVCVNILSM